jgi:TM2 domain-containing membrane protein YozV
VKGLLYLAFSWTGIPIAMGLIDWMIAVPKQPDENGMILI